MIISLPFLSPFLTSGKLISSTEIIVPQKKRNLFAYCTEKSDNWVDKPTIEINRHNNLQDVCLIITVK